MPRFRALHLLTACSIAAAAFIGVTPAYAANVTDSFELDGNVAVTSKDDWATVNLGGGTGNILARTGVAADPAPQSIFTGGGSKDDLDLSGPLSGAGGWKYKDGSVPDKDNIVNAYAAGYNVNGELVIYAGAERFDNSGDAFIGFWFFQNSIGTANGNFTGTHAVGDVLVLANFTGGGTTVNIEVLKWVGSGGNVNGTLQRIAGIAGGVQAKCGVAGTPDSFCGITNAAAGETPPWTFLNKDGNQFYQVADFFELGINMTKVFQAVGGTTPCFSTFMTETRSSSSVSATLKDFVLHSFPLCSIAVTKQCKNPILASSTTVGYTVEGQIQNTGFGTLSSITLTDAPRALGSVGYFACDGSGLPTGNPIGFGGSLNPLASVCYRSSFTTPVNGEDDTITVTASTGNNSSVTASATADCPNLQLSPELSVSKTCAPTLAAVAPYLVVQVGIDGTVCNVQKTGSTTLSNVTVTDTDVSGNLPLKDANGQVGNTLAVGECRTFSASYYPSFATNRLDPPNSTFVAGLAKFSDTVTATGTAPFSTVTPQTATANCTLCPTCTTAGDQCTATSCPASTGATQTNQLLRLK
jgi:hypothetical protein